MVRTVKGVTLSPQERIQAGYDKDKRQGHTCSVLLPNGVSCEVSYTRTDARVHAFAFGVPLRRTRYVYEALPGGIPAVEAKARALIDQLFLEAQQQEQKTMRQKAPSDRTARRSDTGPQISVKLAEELAGRYAACVKHGSGNLIRVGATFSAPDAALREIQSSRHSAIRLINGQTLVIGICNRAAQRWEEPVFLTGGSALQVPYAEDPNTAAHPYEEEEAEPDSASSCEGDDDAHMEDEREEED